MVGQWRLQLPSAAVSPEEERRQTGCSVIVVTMVMELNFSLG